MEYLDFELPLKDLKDQLEKCNMLGDESKVDVRDTSKKLKEKIEAKKKEIYSNITPWQRVQLSRHPSRPYTLDYINALTENNFLELHGDRNISDDKAMIGGLGKIDKQTFMFIGQQKGNNIKTRQYRNFGMANPEGYRKALRLMRLAEKFKIPVVTMVDTPGAYPGIEAEERGQAEAIARNLYEMFNLKTQIIVIVIGEGASGGALGIGIGDKIMMLENTWYSVISPESCSSILWRSWDFKEEAANVLKLTPSDMKENKLIDKIIKEPLGGAHQNRDKIFNTVKKEIISTFQDLKKQKIKDLLENRLKRFTEMGVFNEL
jgi:acetyl-CoA carboxylase carboxyl transferase subunit alpha